MFALIHISKRRVLYISTAPRQHHRYISLCAIAGFSFPQRGHRTWRARRLFGLALVPSEKQWIVRVDMNLLRGTGNIFSVVRFTHGTHLRDPELTEAQIFLFFLLSSPSPLLYCTIQRRAWYSPYLCWRARPRGHGGIEVWSCFDQAASLHWPSAPQVDLGRCPSHRCP